jgi:hypothetical protein
MIPNKIQETLDMVEALQYVNRGKIGTDALAKFYRLVYDRQITQTQFEAVIQLLVLKIEGKSE